MTRNGSDLQISYEPLISPSLNIWFGRQGHWSILNEENQKRFSNHLCTLFKIEGQAIAKTSDANFEKFDTYCKPRILIVFFKIFEKN